MTYFPVIDPVATGLNIIRLRLNRGLSVRDLQKYFGFEEPQAIYKWQRGQSLPSVDNLYALGAILNVTLEEILVPARPKLNIVLNGQQADTCCSVLYLVHVFAANLALIGFILHAYTYRVIKLPVYVAIISVHIFRFGHPRETPLILQCRV